MLDLQLEESNDWRMEKWWWDVDLERLDSGDDEALSVPCSVTCGLGLNPCVISVLAWSGV